MPNYYNKKLSAERLRKCYEIAQQRVQQYLNAEIEHILERITPGDAVLEIGCGYGRVLEKIVEKTAPVIGIDTSPPSLELGRELLANKKECSLLLMDAAKLSFPDNQFELVICIQNGISAFKINQEYLIREALRVTKQGGLTIFSTYSEKFWDERIKWFELQADAGLLGRILYEKTGEGNIVCDDGFTATTMTEIQFRHLLNDIDVQLEVIEIDNSSLFFELSSK